NQTLKTLYTNTPFDLFNLTIVDDISETPKGYEFAEYPPWDWAINPDQDNCVTLTLRKTKNITGQARNLGIYWADKYWGRGDYLYLSDNDVYFTSGWLETLIDTIEDERCRPVIKLIGGWNHPYLQPNFTTTAWEDKNNIHVLGHDAVTGASQL